MANFKYDNKIKYVLWDVETEHLNTCLKNRPWQLSYITFQGNQILGRYDKFLWFDDLKISPDAARITHFNYDSYKSKAEDPRKVLDDFEKLLYNPEYHPIGHNLINFDSYVHNQLRNSLGLKTDYSYLDRTIDTKSLSMMYRLGIKSVNTDQLYEEMLKFSYYIQKGLKTSLSTMAKEFNIHYLESDLHNGIMDCELNFKVWNQLKVCVDWK